jgi:hypothetical protein
VTESDRTVYGDTKYMFSMNEMEMATRDKNRDLFYEN